MTPPAAPILVTGSGGQLGEALLRLGRTAALPLLGLDRTTLDITEGPGLFEKVRGIGPSALINAAAYTAVDKAESEPDRAFAVNSEAPAALAVLCDRLRIPLVHISTDYVFDGTKAGPYKETDPRRPINRYGESKAAGEIAVETHCRRHIIVRTAWLYGLVGRNFVKTMLRLGAERPELRVVEDQHGCPTFADDLAQAVLTITQYLLEHPNDDRSFGIVHCVSGPPTTWYDFAEMIFQVTERRGGWRPKLRRITTADFPTPALRPANSVLDTTRLNSIFGIQMPAWPDALERMLSRTVT